MKAIFVKVYVKEECIEQFKEISCYNSENAQKEPGNRCFDVTQSIDTPNLFLFYELYDSEEAIEYHRNTEHYKKWRDTVADMMAQPRESTKTTLISSNIAK